MYMWQPKNLFLEKNTSAKSQLALLDGSPSLGQALVCLVNEALIHSVQQIERQYRLTPDVQTKYDIAGADVKLFKASLTLSAQSVGEMSYSAGSDHEGVLREFFSK